MKFCVAVLISAGLVCFAEARCNILSTISNGKVKCIGNGAPGSICTFWCNRGYERKGAARIECGKDWTDEPPTCQPTCDPMPDAPKYGYKTCTGCGSLGTECTFDCMPGYEIKGDESTACVRKGRGADWSNPTPICKKEDVKPCEKIKTTTLTVKCDKPTNEEGTVCTYSCEKKGFELVPNSKTKTECKKVGVDENGKDIMEWTVSPPCCLDCSKIKKDIVIALDASDSLSVRDWEIMKNFVSDIVGKFKVGSDAVQFEIMQYSSGYRPLAPFSGRSEFFDLSAAELKTRLADKTWTKEGLGTRTGGALTIAQRYFLKSGERGNRKAIPDMLWVFTDGAADDQSIVKKVSAEIRKSGVDILALAIGDYAGYMSQMVEMTGSRSRVLTAKNFAALTKKLSDLISTKICEESCEPEFKVKITTG